jgi:HipA-like protein
MRNKIKKLLTKLTPWSIGEDFSSKNLKRKKEARFIITYNGKTIGILEHKGNKWIFKYSEQYKKEQFVAPLIDFPIVDKNYEFEELSPFFAARIPNLNQPFHLKKLSKYEGDKNDLVSLLEIFGKKSINNPFELILG